MTDYFKKDEEKREEDEKDINLVISHQGSTDAGEQLPQRNSGNDKKVTSTTTASTTGATATETFTQVVTLLTSLAGVTASVSNKPPG